MQVSSLFAKEGKSYSNFECQVVQMRPTTVVCTFVVPQWTVLNWATNINSLSLFRFFLIDISYINKQVLKVWSGKLLGEWYLMCSSRFFELYDLSFLCLVYFPWQSEILI